MDKFKKPSRRRVLGSGAALAAGSMLGGTLAAPAIAQTSKTIRVLSIEDPFFFALKDVIGDFEKETGLKVELESLSYDALQARLVSAFVSKSSDADVIAVDQMWAGQYVDNGWIRTLSDFARGDSTLEIEDYIPEVLHSMNVWRGNLVTLPVAAYAQGVMYRPSVFDALNLDMPKQGWTWDDYVKALGAINGQNVNGTDMYGSVICGSQPTPIVHMITQIMASHGTRWFKDFPNSHSWDFTPTINSPETLAAVKAYKDIYDQSPKEAINYLWFDAGTRFSQGDIGMFYWWTPYFYLTRANGYMTGERSDIADDIGIAALPTAGNTPQTTSLGGYSFGIPSTSEKPDAAWEFLKWSSAAKTQKSMGLVERYGYQFSDFARKSLYQDSDLKTVYPYLEEQRQMFNSGNGKIARPPAPVYTTLEGILGLEVNNVLTETKTAEEALEQVDTLFNNTLKGNFLIPYSLDSHNDTLSATKSLISDLS